MIVSAKEMVLAARKGGYAVGQFNINNLEYTKAFLEVAEELRAPIILGVGPKAVPYMGGHQAIAAMVRGLDASLGISVPVALHLDHGSYEAAKACIKAGYSSVMYDGSKCDFSLNLVRTKTLACTCDILGISLEAEVGTIGGNEEGILGGGELADAQECKALSETGITMLAAGIGNIHGKYPASWPGLRFDKLEEISQAVGEDMPLVLHGGSGIPEEQVRSAISMGVAKVNVQTESLLAFRAALCDYVMAGKDIEGFTPFAMFAPCIEAIKQVARDKMHLFGCVGVVKP